MDEVKNKLRPRREGESEIEYMTDISTQATAMHATMLTTLAICFPAGPERDKILEEGFAIADRSLRKMTADGIKYAEENIRMPDAVEELRSRLKARH